jgi:Fur family peroxide stress response transcriptional regulator
MDPILEPTFEDLAAELKKKKIRLSHQRLKVLEYLVKNRNHPTVEQIYNTLQSEVPTLSETTIYNTLDALINARMVRVITIEDNETRYDIATETHGHFKCESCGTIYDFNINIDDFPVEDLDGFKINDKNVYFKGLCPKCL